MALGDGAGGWRLVLKGGVEGGRLETGNWGCARHWGCCWELQTGAGPAIWGLEAGGWGLGLAAQVPVTAV